MASQRGSVSVGDGGRKRGGWWWWLLGLLALLLVLALLLGLFSGGDDDEAGQGAGGTTAQTTATTGGTDGGAAAGGGAQDGAAGGATLTVEGESLLPVPGDLSGFVGRTAQGRGVEVQSVPGEQGFFVGTSEEDSVYVEYGARAGEREPGAEFRPEVGQRVDVTGEVRPAPDEPGRTLGVAGADEQRIARQGAFVNADSVTAAE
jgi:hypothetical protein